MFNFIVVCQIVKTNKFHFKIILLREIDKYLRLTVTFKNNLFHVRQRQQYFSFYLIFLREREKFSGKKKLNPSLLFMNLIEIG